MTQPDSAMAPEIADRIAAEIAAEIETRAPFVDRGAQIPDLAAAYALQDRVRDILAPRHGGIGGRKIAWTAAGQAAAMGLPGPAVSAVLGDGVRHSPAALREGDLRSFFFEPEIAAVLEQDIPPRAGGYAPADLAAMAIRLHPAFELMDRRDCAAPSPFAAIAGGVFNAGLVLGGPGAPAREVAHGALRSVVRLGGEVLLDAIGAAPMAPLVAAALIASHASARGETLRAGEILLCGAHLPPRPAPFGTVLHFDLGALGAVELGLEAAQ